MRVRTARKTRHSASMFAMCLAMCSVISAAGCARNGVAQNGIDATVEPRFLACDQDAQCTSTHFVCHGWVAVAAAHVDDANRAYVRKNDQALSVRDCAGPNGGAPPPTAVCRAQRCVHE